MLVNCTLTLASFILVIAYCILCWHVTEIVTSENVRLQMNIIYILGLLPIKNILDLD